MADMKRIGKRNRIRGAELEREVVKRLSLRDIKAKKVPLSGGTNFQKGDVLFEHNEETYQCECKRKKSGFKFLYDNLADNHCLMIKQDRCDILVVVDLDTFIDMLQGGKP